jgi:hypothetical protein
VKGVHYAIDLWTIIELALAHGFGGKNTPQKVQTLEFEIRLSSFTSSILLHSALATSSSCDHNKSQERFWKFASLHSI